MKNFWKRLFCKHDYKPHANTHGDLINHIGGYRTLMLCTKCGKTKWKGEYLEAPNIYTLWQGVYPKRPCAADADEVKSL